MLRCGVAPLLSPSRNPDSSSMLEALVRFVHVLRRAGIPVGTDQVLAASRALGGLDLGRRDDVRQALAAMFLSRREQFEVFDQAFDLYWRPRGPEGGAPGRGAMAAAAPIEEDATVLQRVLDALAAELSADREPPVMQRETRSLALAPDARERLGERDFASMSAREMEQARALMTRLVLPVPEIVTRRRRPAADGPLVDMRASLRASLRGGGDLLPLRRSRRRRRHAPLVVLCDISGSMQAYTRMFLHFLHAITNDRDRVQVFLFGTRLTNVTRPLRHRDVDLALRQVSAAVADWSGGTRIASSLAEFNLRWSRRVLGQSASVLLITDGLDRDAGAGLSVQAERLRKSCRSLMWLNPLLRFEGFEPRAAGVRALLPQVDHFLPAHNVDSLERLAGVFDPRHAGRRPARQSRPAPAGAKER
jgi:uncharacterized protein with von Willebrand factor type A (vWA) domain